MGAKIELRGKKKVVVDAEGKLIVSQKSGEFENARALTPDTLLEFLNKWKPVAR